MTNDINKIESSEVQNAQDAKAALDSIQQMERAGLKRAVPPSWFGIAMALIVGVLVYLVSASLREFYLFPILALPIVVSMHARQSGASVKALPSSPVGIAALIGLICFLLMLIMGGRVLNDLYDMTWAPMLSGAVAGIVIFLLSISERREYLGKVAGDKNQ